MTAGGGNLAAGVLSLQLEGVAELPPSESGDMVVQAIATLLQGARREQRVSEPLAYASDLRWADDEVFEFGGVLQSARVFVDVYAHVGAALPSGASPGGHSMRPPASSRLLGKVAICVDELAADTPTSLTRRLLQGSMRLHAHFACVQGVPEAPARVHPPPMDVVIGQVEHAGHCAPVAPVTSSAAARDDEGHASARRLAAALVAVHGSSEDAITLEREVSKRLSVGSRAAHPLNQPTEDEHDPAQLLSSLTAEEQRALVRNYRTLALLAQTANLSVETLLANMVPETMGGDGTAMLRHSRPQSGLAKRRSSALEHLVEEEGFLVDSSLFDQAEISSLVADYTRRDALERIESPVHRTRRLTIQPRVNSSHESRHTVAGEAGSVLAALHKMRSLLRPAIEDGEEGADEEEARADAEVAEETARAETFEAPRRQRVGRRLSTGVTVDSLMLETVPRGPNDPQALALLAALAPLGEDEPSPRLCAWDFDIFHIESILGPATLPFVVLQHMRCLPLFANLGVNAFDFARFLTHITGGYNDVPYHSSTHAADVFQAMLHIYERGVRASNQGMVPAEEDEERLSGRSSWFFTDAELLGLLVGAAVHDVNHTGQNNAFHIATASDLAITYNDVSILENHHCAFAFRSMRVAGRDFAAKLDPDTYKVFRETVIAVVLGTDMTKHFEAVDHLRTTLELGTGLNLLTTADRRFLTQVVVHAADISNVSRATPIAMEWSRRVTEEFYTQGDEEKRLGLPITKFFDRAHSTRARSQIGFIDFIVQPLFDQLNTVLDISHWIEGLAANRVAYELAMEEEEGASAAGCSARSTPASHAAEDSAAGAPPPPPKIVEHASEGALAVRPLHPPGTRVSPADAASAAETQMGRDAAAAAADGEDEMEGEEDQFEELSALPTLTATTLAAATSGYKPGTYDEIFPGTMGGRSHSASVSSQHSTRSRRQSVASIPETEEVGVFRDGAEEELVAGRHAPTFRDNAEDELMSGGRHSRHSGRSHGSGTGFLGDGAISSPARRMSPGRRLSAGTAAVTLDHTLGGEDTDPPSRTPPSGSPGARSRPTMPTSRRYMPQEALLEAGDEDEAGSSPLPRERAADDGAVVPGAAAEGEGAEPNGDADDPHPASPPEGPVTGEDSEPHGPEAETLVVGGDHASDHSDDGAL